ncbi:MAG: hypothetical protein AMXMBFR47_13730 [Planctomycetota bacterium]
MTSTLATDGGPREVERPRRDREIGRLNGELEKLRAQRRHEARSPHLLLRARRALLESLLESASRTATIDDVRDRLGLAETGNPRWLGAMPGVLQDAGIIRRAGYIETTRARAHGRPVSVWAFTDGGEDRARRWLLDHPLQVVAPLAADFPPATEDPRPAALAPAGPARPVAPSPGPLWPGSMTEETNTPAAVSGHGRES